MLRPLPYLRIQPVSSKGIPMPHLFLYAARGLLATAALLTLSPAAFAQSSPSRSAIDATYQQDRAACLDAASMHERTACLREAGAVRAEALRGRRLAAPTAEELARNALLRCQRLPPDDKLLCERMARGEGSTTGSVAAGGLLRELVTEEPAPAPSTSPATPPNRPPEEQGASPVR